MTTSVTTRAEGVKRINNVASAATMRDLLTKKPFVRIMPDGHYSHGERWTEVVEEPDTTDYLRRKIVTQEDFVRELDPCGHLINDREYYHDIWRKNSEDGKWYLEEVPRYAFAFQQVILIKHLTHLCGNDIQFELADKRDDDESRRVFNAFKRGWADKNMEVAWYRLAKSVKATGDGAFVGYLDNGKFGWKSLSFLDGDRLYPHYDLKTGKLSVFARSYSNYDENGRVIKRYVDVWDNKYYYRYSASGEENSSLTERFKNALKSVFNVGGYTLDTQEEHGFDRIPVAYQRDDWGPCWTFAQETTDNYEMAFSRLAQNNHDFGLPIMYVKGEGSEEVSKEDMSHASKVFFLPSDGDMGFLQKQDASNAYKIELDTLEKQIYTQSFTVKPPELKSGDLPGVAIKLLYSPAVEKAMADANEYDEAVDAMVDIFTFGYGVESEMRLKFNSVEIAHYVKPYVHQNETEQTNNLAMQVQNGFLSKQTASEKSTYATPQEWDRILKEKKEERQMDILLQQQQLEMQSNIRVREEGGDVATGHGASNKSEGNGDANDPSNDEEDEGGTGKKRGRPKGSGTKIWDKNGNLVNLSTGKAYSKWDKWNESH